MAILKHFHLSNEAHLNMLEMESVYYIVTIIAHLNIMMSYFKMMGLVILYVFQSFQMLFFLRGLMYCYHLFSIRFYLSYLV